MTEVPEYLLRRSRERRAALGLTPSGDAPAEGGAPEGAAAEAAPPAQAPAGGAPAPAPAASAPAPAPAAVAPPGPKGAPIKTPWPKSGIPTWMMPVLLLLPLWGIVYVGAFGERGGGELTGPELGAEVYRTAGCGGCHGPSGGGGVGPALAGGEAVLTFPDEADHIAWIETGSGPFAGQPYGDPNRPGGQRVASPVGGMPGFEGQLTPEEIAAVVLFEREGL